MSCLCKLSRRENGNDWEYAEIGGLKYGRGGIRTLGRVAPTSVFKTDALNRSATLPYTVFY